MRARARSSCASSISMPGDAGSARGVGSRAGSTVERHCPRQSRCDQSDARIAHGQSVERNPTPAAPPRRAALVFIFITVLIDILAFGLIIPVLPHLIESFLGGDVSQAAIWYGWFSTAFMTMQFFFTPVQGALSDSLRPAPGDPAVESRPRPRFPADGDWSTRCRCCSSAASSPASPRRASAPPTPTSPT